MKIGNIVSNTNLNLGEEFNMVDSLDNVIQGIPTLIVGYDLVKKQFGDNLDFSSREVDGIHWTFTKDEQKKYYLIDINKFMDYCFDNAIKTIKYIFVDPIQFKTTKIKKIITKIRSLNEPICYLTEKKMLYIFGDNIIFGIDLKLISYLGINDNKIISQIKSMSKVFLEGIEIFIEYKNHLERLDNQPRYIPFLYSINKHG